MTTMPSEVPDGNRKAPDGAIWVCGACGKTARWRFGFQPSGEHDTEASPGWDASCMLHAVLCRSPRDADGLWTAAEEKKEEGTTR